MSIDYSLLIQSIECWVGYVQMAMEEVFKSFCAFGGDKSSAATMDGAKLAKLCRDLSLLDKNLTATDVDIIFSKVKSKAE